MAPRLELAGDEPPPELRAREGRVTFTAEDPTPAEIDREGCIPIDLARD